MDAKTVAKAVSAGRMAFGAAMMVRPPLVMSAWVGEDEIKRPAMDMITRSFGARDLLLGFIGLHVAEREGVNKRTLQSLALCDATDLAVTVMRRESLPGAAVPIMVAVAGGAIVVQLWAANEL